MRVDLGTIAHSHFSYISDMAAPTNVLGMRFGSSHACAARAIVAWFIHWPPDWDWWFERGQSPAPPGYGDLAFRMRLCMMGALGISAAVERWSEADFEQVAHHVQVYKALRPLISGGDQYRLTAAPPYDGDGEWAAMSFVDPDGSAAVLFAFRLARGDARARFALSGLARSARYVLTDDDRGVVGEMSGHTLLTEGVEVTLDQPFTSSLIQLRMASE
jgi:alpha-galactosidase